MNNFIPSSLVVVLFVFLSLAGDVEGGECCKAYYDAALNWHDEKWCSDYCCFELLKYDCCSDITFRASDDKIDDFCSDWFSEHAWGPVLIAVFGIACIIGCCICCYKCCCARPNAPGVVFQSSGGSGGGVTVVSTQQQQQQMMAPQPQMVYDPYKAGYDQRNMPT